MATTQSAPGEAVNHPSHYNLHPSNVEAIDLIEYFTGNLLNTGKYIWRADHKIAAIEDTKKALWYLEREQNRDISFGLPTLPPHVYELADRYAQFEPDPIRAELILLITHAHDSSNAHYTNLQKARPLLSQLIEQISNS